MNKQKFTSNHLLHHLLMLIVMMVLSGATMASAQKATTREISGIVVDENGEPLPAAQVLQARQNANESLHGVVTDINGHFTFSLSSSATAIEVTFIGYKKKTIQLTDQREYQIVMDPQSEMLEEIMVTGYQTLSRERSTGSFTQVQAKDLEQIRPASLGNLLEGQIAGYNDGMIRGVSSMNGVTSPLYVVDGFPIENTKYDSYGSLEETVPQLNMEDIESITVLKDAAAASIYGARAANGVIVITTKKAKQGQTNIQFSSTLTVQPYSIYTKRFADAATMVGIEREWAASNASLQDPAMAAEYANMQLDNGTYTSPGVIALLKAYAGRTDMATANNQLDQWAKKGYQYYKDVEKAAKQNPFYQQYNLSFQKGSDNNNFSASLTYKNDQESDKYTGSNSYGINLQNSTRINRILNVDLGAYLNYGRSATQAYDLLSPGFNYMPYQSLYNADGSAYTSLYADRASLSNLQTLANYDMLSMDITPLDEVSRNQIKQKDLSSRLFVKLNFKLTDWLNYSAQYQYEYGKYDRRQELDKNTYEVRNTVNTWTCWTPDHSSVAKYIPEGNILKTQNQTSDAYNFRHQLNFQKTLSERHEIVALVGQEIRHQKIQSRSDVLYGYDDALLTYTTIDAATLSHASGILKSGWWSDSSNGTYLRELQNRYVSFYSNAGYTFDDKYTVTASIRYDKSNLWGLDSSQNKPIWSVGGSWNMHRESWINDISWIDMLKARLSYGIGGNVAKDSAPYLTATYNPNYNVGGQQGAVSSRPNPNLTWEKTKTFNVGFDFSAFSGRLNATFDFYNKRGENLLANTMGVPTEGFGYNTYSINNGEMLNRGFELSLSGELIRTKDFSWSANLIYGYNHNKVTYVNVKAPMYVLQFDYPDAYPQVGNPYRAIYAYQWAGLSADGIPQVYNENGEAVTYNPSSLDAIVYAGSTTPTYGGSFGTSLRYKNWNFSMLLVYEGGHKMRNSFLPMLNNEYNYATWGYEPYITSGINSDIENRWKQPGDEKHTDIPRLVFSDSPLYTSDSYDIYKYADVNVISASNLRLKNISLSYRLPNDFVKKAMIKGAKLNFNMENVCMIAADDQAKYLLGGYNNPNFVWGLTVDF